MGNKTVNTILSVNRPGVGYTYNSSGTMVISGFNTPRIDYDPTTLQPKGILIESGKTNLLVQSEQLNTTWVTTIGPTSIQPNSVVAPNGFLVADKIVEANTAPPGSPYYIVYQSQSGLSSNAYTVSIYYKAAERFNTGLRIDDGTSSNVANVGYNLSTGTYDNPTSYGTAFDPIATITPINNGWFRCSLSVKFTDTVVSTIRVMLRVRNELGYYNYTGDGLSGLYAWGAQLEAARFVSSYIPTSTSAVSRISDAPAINGMNWINVQEGTFIIEAQRCAVPTANIPMNSGLLLGISQNDGANASVNFSNSIYVYNESAWSNNIYGIIFANNVGQLDSLTLQPKNGIDKPFKFGFAYKTDAVISTDANLFFNTNNFNLWTLSNMSVQSVSAATTAPDGSYSASKIVESSDAISKFHVLSNTSKIVAGSTYTITYYLKAAERTEVVIGFDSPIFASYQYGRFNLSTGVATTYLGTPTLSMTSVGNGWYKCSVTTIAATTSSGTTTAGPLQLLDAAGNNSYIGNGVSGVYVWNGSLTFTNSDGSQVLQRMPVVLPTNQQIARIGCAPWTPNGNHWDGWIRSIKYYPQRVSNTTLTTLST